MNVLLPAPFSPISACTSPARALNSTRSSATIPPKRFDRLLATMRSIGCAQRPPGADAPGGSHCSPNLLCAGSFRSRDLDPVRRNRQGYTWRLVRECALADLDL